MSVADVIDSFATGTYTVTRTAAGTRSGGIVTPGVTSTLNVEGVVMPVSGRELRVLASGVRAEDVRVFYTKTLLRVLEPEADLISIDGESWRVFACERWDLSAFGEAYYRALVSRIA